VVFFNCKSQETDATVGMIRKDGDMDFYLLLIDMDQLITEEVEIGKRENFRKAAAVVDTRAAGSGSGSGDGDTNMGRNLDYHGEWAENTPSLESDRGSKNRRGDGNGRNPDNTHLSQ
jgi:hypothetical protein